MTGQGWCLLDTGLRDAAENLALDEALLSACDAEGGGTFRLLQFSRPCVLVGFNQAVSLEVREEYCRRRGIEVNRRITGGGAIYCDPGQLGWELIAPKAAPGLPARPEELYALFCEGAVRGLRKLGIGAAFRPRNDIEVGGRKLSGTGGTEKGRAFLFQGTLLVDFDVEAMVGALRVPAEKLRDREIHSVRERVTCLAWELGAVPDLEAVKVALRSGMEELLGASFVPRGLSPLEEKLLRELRPKFASSRWTHHLRKPSLHRRELRAVHRAPGGLIRVCLMADAAAGRIRQVLLTGDFFAHPDRAVYDLEAGLKDCPYEPGELRATVRRLFEEREIEIPGCGPEDFCAAIGKAVRRLEEVEAGLTVEEANSLNWAVEPRARGVRTPVLLLPYCAKLPECAWRREDGCDRCGRCDVGEAYRLAEEARCRVTSITDYEHLRQVLEEERAAGASGFIGCCCDAFYAKHARDFEEIGLPGVLIDVDNTTCYELGALEEAKAGNFERQTRLKLGLLEKVLRGAARRPEPGAEAEERP